MGWKKSVSIIDDGLGDLHDHPSCGPWEGEQ
jgi:hypothetical protein